MANQIIDKFQALKAVIESTRSNRPVLMRWITGLSLAPILILMILLGGWYFTIFIAIIGVLALSEYFRITFISEGKNISIVLFVFALGISLGIIGAIHFGRWNLALALLSLNLICCASFSVFQFKIDTNILVNIARQIQGMTYIPLSLACIVGLRNGDHGIFWIFFLLIIIFSGDIGAFYVGINFGKHKLCPSISPGKTIEGAIGGIVSNLIMGSILKILFLPTASWSISILFFITIGVIGQIGDLFESELKRSSNIKDSGWILPGHGGILDRIDAVLFAAPVTYIFKEFLI